jgi:hypothetical protein
VISGLLRNLASCRPSGTTNTSGESGKIASINIIIDAQLINCFATYGNRLENLCGLRVILP